MEQNVTDLKQQYDGIRHIALFVRSDLCANTAVDLSLLKVPGTVC